MHKHRIINVAVYNYDSAIGFANQTGDKGVNVKSLTVEEMPSFGWIELLTKESNIVLHMVCSFRSEFLTGHSLKILGRVAFIHYFNAEHSLDYIFHGHDTAHTAIFIGYY